MTLHELESGAAVQTFKQSHAHTLVCFSATWCGPCKASKPTLEALAQSYAADPSLDLHCGIAYEHNLGQAIHEFQVRAFPTYVLFVDHGTKEFGRIQGVNFDGIRQLVDQAGCKKDLGKGNTLAGDGDENAVKALSPAEARAQRLAMFDKKNDTSNTSTAAATAEMGEQNDDKDNDDNDNDGDAKMDAANTNDTIANKDGDTEMTDAAPTEKGELVDPTEHLSKEDIATLTESMGFTLLRAQKGLLHSTSGIEGAIEWLMEHQDDADIDDPISTTNMPNPPKKPLTEEEKAQKVQRIKELLAAKRKEREQLEKVANVDREVSRRNDAKKAAKTKEEMEKLARQREAKLRKKEKEDFKRERARIKAEIEKDKRERAAHKGKLTSKLGIDGYNPDAIQYNVDADGGNADGSAARPAPKKKGSVAKIDEYIQKITSYKAGGDGGKCLKILILYLKNIVANPTEEKYQKINMDNKVYKTKIKPFVGAKVLLLAVGFAPNDDNSALILAELSSFGAKPTANKRTLHQMMITLR